jgi:hypothetical protein
MSVIEIPFYDLHERNISLFFSSLLLSTVMRYARDGPLDDAVSHYKQTPSVGERLLSTRIACH